MVATFIVYLNKIKRPDPRWIRSAIIGIYLNSLKVVGKIINPLDTIPT